ncbi:MAG: hypothetical protein V1804_04550 [Patescibacteria group bacterium]
MLKKLFLILFLIFLGVFVYFAYPIVKARYFENGNSQKQEPKTIINQTTSEDLGKSSAKDNVNSADMQNQADETGTNPNISAKDCDNECADFSDNEKNLKYCQEVCGLSTTESSENCDSKQGIEKDYCLKNFAIQKKDFEKCKKIQDASIQKTCKNRISEDIIENQQL